MLHVDFHFLTDVFLPMIIIIMIANIAMLRNTEGITASRFIERTFSSPVGWKCGDNV